MYVQYRSLRAQRLSERTVLILLVLLILHALNEMWINWYSERTAGWTVRVSNPGKENIFFCCPKVQIGSGAFFIES
jgi:hypothetical protein